MANPLCVWKGTYFEVYTTGFEDFLFAPGGNKFLYRPVHRLLGKLYAGRADETFHKVYTNILRVDMLILDDFGLVPLSTSGAQDLFAVPAQVSLYEIIRDRYKRKSIILTSNRAPKEWAEVFGNSLLASAALDRLTHHSHFISGGVVSRINYYTPRMTGESYRQRQRRLANRGSITGEKEMYRDNTSEKKGGDM